MPKQQKAMRMSAVVVGTHQVTIERDSNTGRTVYADAKSGRRLRDAVTGEPIFTDTQHILRVRTERVDYVPPKRERDLAADLGIEGIETTPIPTQINTAQPDPDGRLGGRKWHPELKRYLGEHTTAAVAAADRELREWWQGPHAEYALARVRRGFIARYGEERGTQAMNAALAILRDGEDYHQVAEQFGNHTVSWVDHQCRLAYKFAYQKASA